MFDRRLLTYFDWSFAGAILGMACLGVLSIYSANAFTTSPFRQTLHLRQLTWLAAGLFVLVLACTVSYRNVARFAYVIFALNVFLLLVVLVLGKTGLGAQRWIRIGPITVQPSEFMKLSLVLFLARYFDDRREILHQPKTMLLPAGITLACAALVLKQPDLGTALLLVFNATAIMLLLGLHWKYLLPLGITGGVLAPLLWAFLKDYQRRRILVYLNPDLDPLGASYHIAQSKIAVGSGGAFGKGWMAASQSQLNFLPMNHTDFLFAVLAEQWGFLGCLLVLLVFVYRHHPGVPDRRRLHRLLRQPPGHGHHHHAGDPGVHQRGHGPGHAPRRGHPAPSLELRRLLHADDHAQPGPPPEHPHAAVHVLAVVKN